MSQSLESAALELGIDIAGLDLGCIGVWQRFPTLTKPRKRNGAAMVRVDGSVFLENFETGETANWCANAATRERTPDERRERAEQLRRNLDERDRHQRMQWADAAEVARQTWRHAKRADASHPYLLRKKLPTFLDLHEVDAINGRQGRWLITAAYDRGLDVRNLECINELGEKHSIRGAQRKGLFGLVGDGMPTDEVIIAEGWSTAAALATSLKQCIVIAFGAGNLRPTLELWHQLLSRARLIIAADHDANGVGQQRATDAGLAIAHSQTHPADVLIKAPATPGDWCDMYTELGPDAVARSWRHDG